ncbi:MAG: hypothetical protein U1F68_06015 [Gammaproteobacteria bacterium]
MLIADELTSALDVTVQTQVLALIDDLVRSRGMGLIFISHDPHHRIVLRPRTDHVRRQDRGGNAGRLTSIMRAILTRADSGLSAAHRGVANGVGRC